MNPSNLHKVLVQGLNAAYGLREPEVAQFIQRYELVQECQQFLVAVQRLPVGPMKMAVGFVDKYFGLFPHARFRDLGHNKYELCMFKFEDGVRVGLGLLVKHGETSLFRIINNNGSEAIVGNKTFLL